MNLTAQPMATRGSLLANKGSQVGLLGSQVQVGSLPI